MTLTSRSAQPQTPRARAWALTLLVAGTVGVAVAIAVVYAYYNDPWRPLAHSLGLWAVMASAVGFRRRLPLAVGASIASLATAVVTFYVGLKVGHDIRWAGSGSVMSVNWDRIGLWLVLAVLAGVAFGLLGSFAPHRDWKGAAATAALVGLLMADAYRRYSTWGGIDVAVAVDVLAALAVFVIATRDNKRPLLTLGLTFATAALGLVAVSAPDFIEQGLIEGF
ncbi:DUF6518 family protein [Modestobacter sp. VKM Ac-2984]|nr:DUF6518 family protein [Modestobacter sp. VKM Ac-2984]MCZ2815327.1 DUF6518 family protein [Modestobacter sp. VKM Ac-2984]